MFVVMCGVFVLELGYFGNKMYECKQYIASVHIPKGPKEMLVKIGRILMVNNGIIKDKL